MKLLPLLLHFNADGHSINDLKVCILKGNFKDTEHRKLAELQLFIDFENNKFGFDKEISFLSRYDTFRHKGYLFFTVILSYTHSYHHFGCCTVSY